MEVGTARDRSFMRRALALARRGWGQVAPNPLVGAVVVRDDAIVGLGWHARYGEGHGEAVALRDAGERAAGSTVYVTLEPCTHVGKTPPCVDALIAARVARVVIATRDPNPVARGGVERLRAAGIAVTVGVEERTARELNAAFLHSHGSSLPFVTLKLAMSLDGAIADARGHSRWITGARARREVHCLRAGSDAIAVGIGTVLADDPMLTVRDAPPPRVAPARIVFDRTTRLPLESALVRTAGAVRTIVVAAQPDPARASALETAGVEVLPAVDLGDALAQLRRRGLRSVLVEGGAKLVGAVLGSALGHRLIIFQSPVLLGAGALSAFAYAPAVSADRAPHLRVLERRAFDDDLMTRFVIGES